MLAGRPHEESPSAGHAADAAHAPAVPIRMAPVVRADIELDSARLLQGQREVLIRHGSEVYRLRHTRNDKLILTK